MVLYNTLAYLWNILQAKATNQNLKFNIMANSTNLVTVENASFMKCHINSLLGFQECFTTPEKIEAAMSHFDYESEIVETVVFNWLRENREVIYS